MLDGKRVLVTGGTGSLGTALVRRLLSGASGQPSKVTVMSRDETKQYHMRLAFLRRESATDEIIYRNSRDALTFRIGDIRDYATVQAAVSGVEIIFNAAAMKQVPTCEYFPSEAVETNVLGPRNLVRAIQTRANSVETVIGVSTDKACKPINVMGMTKAIQERVFVEANIQSNTRFACVRYGNVVASRGSAIPLFMEQISHGGPVTLTMKEMTRFLLTLDRAVDTILEAVANARPGETLIPRVPSARMVDVAQLLIGDRNIPIEFIGIRPGEKVHEVLISEEERYRTVVRGEYYAIQSMLPELSPQPQGTPPLEREYSSADATIDSGELRALLAPYLKVGN